MKPITKADVEGGLNDREFPDFVIQAFNECIMESRVRNSKDVIQINVVDRIVKLGNVDSKTVFDNHWLDVERHYRKAGWTVKFDKPAYYESYKAYYTFS